MKASSWPYRDDHFSPVVESEPGGHVHHPVTLAFTILVLYLAGITINIMSLVRLPLRSV